VKPRSSRNDVKGAPDAEEVSYGFKKVHPSEKRRLVLGHFEAIALRYDLADALLSFGLHFLWRRRAMRRLRLHIGDRVPGPVRRHRRFRRCGRQSRGIDGKGGGLRHQQGHDGRRPTQGRPCRTVGPHSLGSGGCGADGICQGQFRRGHRGLRPSQFCCSGPGTAGDTPRPQTRWKMHGHGILHSHDFWFRRLYQFYSFCILPGPDG
jgi:hypothetical protein